MANASPKELPPSQIPHRERSLVGWLALLLVGIGSVSVLFWALVRLRLLSLEVLVALPAAGLGLVLAVLLLRFLSPAIPPPSDNELFLEKGLERESTLVVENEQQGAVSKASPSYLRWLFGCYLVVVNIVIVYFLVRLWPRASELNSAFGTVKLIPGSSSEIQISIETRFLCIVLLAGALGAYTHLAASFANYLGSRRPELCRYWSWWYVQRPFNGATLAMIVYFVIRGGLLSAASGTRDLSPYGIAALSGFVGMFADQATRRLRTLFNELFKEEKPVRPDSPRHA